jgi:hypothetical protein
MLPRANSSWKSALGELAEFLQTKLCTRGLGRSDWPNSATPVSPDRIAKAVD